MKKMMIALFAGFLAIAANAGSVIWAASGLKGSDDATLVGGVAYLFEGTYDFDAIASAIQEGTFSTDSAISSATTGASGNWNKRNIGSYQNETVTMYTVLFDAATIDDAENFKVASFSDSFGTTGNKTFNFASALNGESWTPVPEPTAIALLMLGVAAVGLKRRA